MNWHVVQLGSRENYAVARALEKSGLLNQLVTDLWFPTDSLIARGDAESSKLATRFHFDLKDVSVGCFNYRYVAFEFLQKMLGGSGWDLIMRRNRWFQKQVVRYLQPRLKPEHILFSYSYTAKAAFQLGKKTGCRLVLGQIDPGVGEEHIVANEVAKLPGIETGFRRAPKPYWDDWREECELADDIIVNSQWSQDLLVAEGIDPAKLHLVPLVYERPEQASPIAPRDFPTEFSRQRPLRVLFLGQVIPRKGIHYVIEAARQLSGRPVRFTIVGDPGPWKTQLECLENVEVVGRVPRQSVDTYYQSADVFLFPTLSDGFGLTQLEAQYWGLPLICSKNCGRVVQNDINGVELACVSADAIIKALELVIQAPALLEQWSSRSGVCAGMSLHALGNRLVELSERRRGSQ